MLLQNNLIVVLKKYSQLERMILREPLRSVTSPRKKKAIT